MLLARPRDPNFPEGGLAITPSSGKYKGKEWESVAAEDSDRGWQQDKQEDIDEYGIAGRVWEAAYLLTGYLSAPMAKGSRGEYEFDPPCSLFDRNGKGGCVVELGAGVGVAGIHLALELTKAAAGMTTIILTDLENVLSLLHRNVQRASLDETAVKVRALPWGSTAHADAVLLNDVSPDVGLTHIICSDLVYFPELLAPLLRSLVHLTRPRVRGADHPVEVIIGYKIRSFSKEEAFWRAFGVWFDFAPVLCRSRSDCSGSEESEESEEPEWRRFGEKARDFGAADDDEAAAEDEIFVFTARRRESTRECDMPVDDDHLLGGWLVQEGGLRRGSGAETFELLLIGAMQA